MLHAVNVSHVGIPTHHLSVFKLGTGICAVLMADAVLTGKVHLSVNFHTLPRGSARASFAKQTALASEDGVSELVLCLCLSDCIFLSICSVFLSVQRLSLTAVLCSVLSFSQGYVSSIVDVYLCCMSQECLIIVLKTIHS